MEIPDKILEEYFRKQRQAEDYLNYQIRLIRAGEYTKQMED